MHTFDNVTILCGPEFNSHVAYTDIMAALRGIDVDLFAKGTIVKMKQIYTFSAIDVTNGSVNLRKKNVTLIFLDNKI